MCLVIVECCPRIPVDPVIWFLLILVQQWQWLSGAAEITIVQFICTDIELDIYWVCVWTDVKNNFCWFFCIPNNGVSKVAIGWFYDDTEKWRKRVFQKAFLESINTFAIFVLNNNFRHFYITNSRRVIWHMIFSFLMSWTQVFPSTRYVMD